MCFESVRRNIYLGFSMMRGKPIKNICSVIACFSITGIMFYYLSGYAVYYDESAMKSGRGFSILKYNLAGNEIDAALLAVTYFVLASMFVFGINLVYKKLNGSRKNT